MTTTKKGFIPVMLTPFHEDGEIDFKGLCRLTELYVEAGASGLFANCLSSEMFELTENERLQVIKQTIKSASGLPVVATGSFGNSLQEQADFVKKVYDTGADAVIILANAMADSQDSDEVFEDRMMALLDLTENIPLGLYECPVPYKRLVSADILSRLSRTGSVIYHKDTCLDIEQIKAKIKATEGQNFGLYDAYMVHAVDSLKAGSAGLSCIQGNYFPELIVWLCDNYNKEELSAEIQKVQDFLVKQMDVMHHVYPTVSKLFLQKRNFPISTFTRRNVGKISPAVANDIETLYLAYKDLQDTIPLQEIVC